MFSLPSFFLSFPRVTIRNGPARGITTDSTPEHTTSRFTVSYDGEALRTHEMDVKQLAPALLALLQAFDRIQRHVAPGNRVALKAKATREGSFNIDLILYMAGEVKDVLLSDDVTAMVTAAAIGGMFVSAIRFAKTMIRHGGRPKKTEDAGADDNGPGMCEVTFPDGARVTTFEGLTELIRDEDFVRDMKATLSPALSDGINSVAFRSEDASVTVDCDEADDITGLSMDDADYDSDVQEMIVQALDLSFRDGGKWRVTDGWRTRFVPIRDEEFLARIDRGEEAFRKGDIYRVLMRVEKRINENGRLESRYVAIEKVLEHRTAADQTTLF